MRLNCRFLHTGEIKQNFPQMTLFWLENWYFHTRKIYDADIKSLILLFGTVGRSKLTIWLFISDIFATSYWWNHLLQNNENLLIVPIYIYIYIYIYENKNRANAIRLSEQTQLSEPRVHYIHKNSCERFWLSHRRFNQANNIVSMSEYIKQIPPTLKEIAFNNNKT